jgi:dihydroxyacetone kinase DhaKLM complex PTS-EIIA-like component DhaM
MNLEVCCELINKKIKVFDCPIVEGAYSAAALIEANVSM